MIRTIRNELPKLAKISHIQVKQEEFEHAVATLDTRLAYTTMVNEILAIHKGSVEMALPKGQNVMRSDVAASFDAQKILALAPRREENFFVVPVIIKQK